MSLQLWLSIFVIHSYYTWGGLLESVYEAALAYELEKRGIAYTRQQGIVTKYEEAVLDVGVRTDIIMEGNLVVEIKSVERLEKVHHKTVLTYLQLSAIKLALLVNFKVNLIKEGIHRKSRENWYKKKFSLCSLRLFVGQKLI